MREREAIGDKIEVEINRSESWVPIYMTLHFLLYDFKSSENLIYLFGVDWFDSNIIQLLHIWLGHIV